MARGIGAVIFVVSLIFSITILGGVGYYASMGVNMDVSERNEDVKKAAQQLSGIGFGEGRSSSILQGPLAAVMPAVRILQAFTAIVLNTSGVIQLLYGLPKEAADLIELFARLAMLVTLVFVIRSGSPV